MQVTFEPTRALCLHFASQVLSDILAQPEVASGAPFRLIDLAKPIIDTHVTHEQQAIRLKKKLSEGDDPISKIIKFYADSRARNISELVWVGDGMFRLSTPNDITDEQLAEAELEETPIEGDDDGHVYAYSFPVWIKAGEPFPIKVGKANSDAEKRVADQVVSTSTAGTLALRTCLISVSVPVRCIGCRACERQQLSDKC